MDIEADLTRTLRKATLDNDTGVEATDSRNMSTMGVLAHRMERMGLDANEALPSFMRLKRDAHGHFVKDA